MMKKQVPVFGIILLLVIIIFIGCIENNESNTNKQNQLPVPIISFPQGARPRWWNDTLRVSAEDSYDSDGYIVDYRWFFETGTLGSIESGDTRTGINTYFWIPVVHVMDGYGNLTLVVTDDKGATAFAYYDIPIRSSSYLIGFKQINSSTVFNITSVQEANNLTGQGFLKTAAEEIGMKIYVNGSLYMYENPVGLPEYIDKDKDGFVSEGDTFDISGLCYGSNPECFSGSTVKIELVGCSGHNWETIVGSLEVEIG
jgi:hypothetical protein